ncbi:spermatogenesis-associated protein 4 [Bombina bombina]|uniref:spermatogenesis-associated protein 4 n=1 Tax=Bombina bombina TaxID=8345 RepID=UPI00235AEAB7|nr:spermatogenesis-associated protein 4 [Bombina bombina]
MLLSSYQETPRKTGVPRDVLRWLQSLDLSLYPKNVRRDFSNGYIAAEIFSWYFPKDIQLHSYENGTSIANKLSNWSQLEKFFHKRNLNVSKELIDGTIHCKAGAAELLLQDIYVMLTNRRIKTVQDNVVDFTDRYYQEKLPMVARSTATKSVKNNITLSELLMEPDILINRKKAHAVLDLHLQQRLQERIDDLQRFDLKPSLGELAVRLPPEAKKNEESLSKGSSASSRSNVSEVRSKTSVQFKEISVKQNERCYVTSSIDSFSSSSA